MHESRVLKRGHNENGKFVAPWLGKHCQFITFMFKPYYIYGCSFYYVYIYGQFLLIYGWYYICGFLLHLWVIQL